MRQPYAFLVDHRRIVQLVSTLVFLVGCTVPVGGQGDIQTEASETFFETGDVAHLEDLGVFIVATQPYGVVAFEDRDPRSDCLLLYSTTDVWAFEDSCHSSKYSIDGTYLAGPSPRSLTPFPTYVSDGELFIESDPAWVRNRLGEATNERESPTFRPAAEEP